MRDKHKTAQKSADLETFVYHLQKKNIKKYNKN